MLAGAVEYLMTIAVVLPRSSLAKPKTDRVR